MPIKELDEATKRAIDCLSLDDTSRERSYAFEHELLFYGVEAVAHYHLMSMARDISEGKISLDEFVKKYGLSFGINPESMYPKLASPQFTGNLTLLANDGIFVPQQAYNLPYVRRSGKIQFFSTDYFNRTRQDGWVDESFAEELIKRTWQPTDLQDPELAEKGMRFDRDLWKTCLLGFEDLQIYQKGVRTAQPDHVTELGKQLIKYYSSLVLGEPQQS